MTYWSNNSTSLPPASHEPLELLRHGAQRYWFAKDLAAADAELVEATVASRPIRCWCSRPAVSPPSTARRGSAQ